MHGTSVVGREVDLQVLDLEQRTLGALQLVEFVVNIRLLTHLHNLAKLTPYGSWDQGRL